MLYFLILLLGCLLPALVPHDNLPKRFALVMVGLFYGLVLWCARLSRAAAWQQKEVIGTEEIPSGLASTNPSHFVPVYRGEEVWQWLLFFMPILAWLCWYYINRQRNASLREALVVLYLPYAMLALYGTGHDWFPGPVVKPTYRNAAMTIPY